MLRNKVRKTLVMKLPSYDSNATYRDNLLWRIVMHYGEMPRTTLGQVTFGLWRMKYLRYSKKNLLLNYKPVTRIWKKNVQLTKSWKAIKKQTVPNLSTSNGNQRLPGACNRSPGSKLLSITTQLHCGGHLGGRTQLPDTILEEDHPMTIPSKFGSNCATGSRQDGFYVNFP
jgi:hypothetical protein